MTQNCVVKFHNTNFHNNKKILFYFSFQGYLYFKRDTKFNKRWFVLKGNLLFYFEKKGDKEPLGLLLLEGCKLLNCPKITKHPVEN